MSSPPPAGEGTVETEPARPKRWEFRKKKKLEKRRKRRQLNAKKNKAFIPPAPTIEPQESEEAIAENQKYERDKALWEEREQKFKAIELAKKSAKEKEEKAKALSQKRWKDTLLQLPLMPPKFTANNAPFKTFVQAGAEQQQPRKERKTYRDRYLDQKRANIMK